MSSAPRQNDQLLACNEPAELLRLLEEPELSQRKLRLLACACCQRVWPLLTRSAVHDAVETAERFADGLVDVEELRSGWSAVRGALRSTPLHTKWEDALMAALHTTSETLSVFTVSLTAEAAARALDDEWRQRHPDTYAEYDVSRRRRGSIEERRYQSHLIRDLFPKEKLMREPIWERWQNGTIVALARAIYEEERFQDLPVLADALEDCGCPQEALLAHCRQPGPHVRGCFAVDLILAKDH